MAVVEVGKSVCVFDPCMSLALIYRSWTTASWKTWTTAATLCCSAPHVSCPAWLLPGAPVRHWPVLALAAYHGTAPIPTFTSPFPPSTHITTTTIHTHTQTHMHSCPPSHPTPTPTQLHAHPTFVPKGDDSPLLSREALVEIETALANARAKCRTAAEVGPGAASSGTGLPHLCPGRLPNMSSPSLVFPSEPELSVHLAVRI